MNKFDRCYSELCLIRQKLEIVESLLMAHNPRAAESSEVAQSRRVEMIKNIIGSKFTVPNHELCNGRRTERVAWPRQIAMSFCKEFTELTLEEIGSHFGGRDHGTVHHAISCVKERCEASHKSQKIITDLRNVLKVQLK